MFRRFDQSRRVIVIASATTRAAAAARYRLAQHPTELGAETEHQDEINGRVEDDEDIGDGRELLQPARELVDGCSVDGVEDEDEQRHRAADGEDDNDDERQDGGAQFALLRRVQRRPVSTRLRHGARQADVEGGDGRQRRRVHDDDEQRRVVEISVDAVEPQLGVSQLHPQHVDTVCATHADDHGLRPVLEELRYIVDDRQNADDDDRQTHLADTDPACSQRRADRHVPLSGDEYRKPNCRRLRRAHDRPRIDLQVALTSAELAGRMRPVARQRYDLLAESTCQQDEVGRGESLE